MCFGGAGASRILGLGLAALVGCGGDALAAQAGASGNAALVGVQFAQPPYHDDASLSVLNNMKGGGKFVLLATTAKRNIIDFARQETRARLKLGYVRADGRETPVPAGDYSLWPFATVGKDGKSALVQIHFKAMPPAGVTAIHVRGELVLTTATSLAVAEVKNVALRKGETFTLGPAKVEVTGIGKPRWGNGYPLQVKMKSGVAFKRIHRLQFIDAQGTVIQSTKGGTWTMGFGGTTSVETGFNLKRKVDRVTLKAHYWQGVDNSAMPVDFRVRTPF